MARLPRFCPAGLPQHIVQRGNNRNTCFASEADFAAYANWLGEYATKYDVGIHAWVLMTNHVHLLATPSTDDGIPLMMQSLGRRYVRHFNLAYSRSGTLWEGRYRSSAVQTEDYLLACYRYIELNPVRAGMVDDPAQYRWSSYHCNALGRDAALCTPHPQYLALARFTDERLVAYRALFDAGVDDQLATEVTSSINKGMAFGSERFKDEVEALYGRRVKPAAVGRPKKQET
jgi:putative transposase